MVTRSRLLYAVIRIYSLMHSWSIGLDRLMRRYRQRCTRIVELCSAGLRMLRVWSADYAVIEEELDECYGWLWVDKGSSNDRPWVGKGFDMWVYWAWMSWALSLFTSSVHSKFPQQQCIQILLFLPKSFHMQHTINVHDNWAISRGQYQEDKKFQPFAISIWLWFTSCHLYMWRNCL